MAGVRFEANSGELTTGTATKTLLQLVAAANQRVKLDEFSVSFKGVDNSAAPILVELVRQSTAGTSSGVTPVKDNPADDETLQTTAVGNCTAEPTTSDVVKSELVHPQGGGYTWQAPFGREVIIPGGGRLGLRVTAGASVTAVARMAGEE